MLTNEKVLAAFQKYLASDDVCEVVLTSRGYTVMLWEPHLEEWCDVQYCATPEALRDALLSACHEYLSFQCLSRGQENPTPEQGAEIQKKCEAIYRLCE